MRDTRENPSLRNILISGGTGFVGSAIARAVAEQHPKCTVTVLDRAPPNGTHELPDHVAFIQADVTVPDTLYNVLQQARPEIVIHTAGIVPALSERFGRRLEQLVRKTNIEGTRNMLDAARQAGVKGFVYTSTCCVVTDDMSMPYENIDEQWPIPSSSLIYGESKAAAERIVLEANSSTMATCSLRPSVLCGPGDPQLLPPIHTCISKWETPFIIGDGYNLWDVTYVTNIGDAHVLAAENLISSRTAAGEAFFIQNNEPITFRDFCLAIWAQFGHTPPFEIHIPRCMAYVAGCVYEILTWVSGSSTTLSRGSVGDACSVRYASGDKAKRILGYEARVGIEEAVRLSCEDYARRNGIELPAPVSDKKQQ
ncbi:hypothetical protein SI65_01308 [Aspergillus cristatus]|uniref:Ketoreductase domain-containing protein n=1 Tax=Aspergillus cristatus TaxID=573508 RepID=A0A1E3BRZ2_ASPCR|nr:hypothetical protein SI65_01308 [Aspergillus cristatus]